MIHAAQPTTKAPPGALIAPAAPFPGWNHNGVPQSRGTLDALSHKGTRSLDFGVVSVGGD